MEKVIYSCMKKENEAVIFETENKKEFQEYLKTIIEE